MALWRAGIIRTAAGLNPVRSAGDRILCRGFAAVAEEQRDIVKEKFIEKIDTFYKLLAEFKKFRIIVDPNDKKVVKEFSDNLQKARQNVGLPPPEVQLKQQLCGLAARCKTLRQYYERLGRFQASKGMEDVEGNQAMLDVITRVEGKIGKPLAMSDKEGLKLFEKESAAALEKLDTHPDQLAQYCEEANLNIARTLLSEMKQSAIQTVDKFYKDKGEDFQINFRELDPRNFIRLPGESTASKPSAS